MQATLLDPKVHVPPLGHSLVSRPRLTAALSTALARPLTLVFAPAGYGKTTLVSSWLRAAGVPVAWLSLDEGDNDPVRFRQYFLAALEQIVPSLGPELAGMLKELQAASFQALLSLLSSEVSRQPAPAVLVLDDLHLVHAQPILEMLTSLLERLPPPLHLVLISRSDPPLPLSRLRARGQVTEIRAEQLRFTRDESARFLNEVAGLALPAGDIAAMEERTEGWVAGLQLAAIAMQARLSGQGGGDLHGFVSAFTGSHYYIIDYLTEEVLEHQPERVRAFLLQTSILERMCGPLCEAVVKVDSGEAVYGQATLEVLQQKNLFVIPLDDERRWYRYHHLFADVLHRHLEHQNAGQLPGLHRRASRWYEQNGFIPEAIHHALLAGDQDPAAQMVDHYGCLLLMRGEVATLLRLLDAVEPQCQTRPWLAVQKAWTLILSGQLEQAEQPLLAAERLVSGLEPSVEVREILGTAAAARAQRANRQGDTRLAAEHAQQALSYLADSAPLSCSLRSVATSILGDASWINGDLERAESAYEQAVLVGQAAGDPNTVIMANTDLGEILIERGQLYRAARVYSEALRLATRPDGQRLPLAAEIYAGLSRISYEWNQLETAARHANQCMEVTRRWGNREAQAIGRLMLARLEQALEQQGGTVEALRAADQAARECQPSPRRSVWLAAALARLWLVQGNLERACRILQQNGVALDVAKAVCELPFLKQPGYVALLHVLLAQGEYDIVLTVSQRLLQQAEANDQLGLVVEILVLQALAHQGKKDVAGALPVLGRALVLAQPEQYVRVFLDEGEPMARLLYQAKSHRVGAGFAGELLAAMNKDAGVTPVSAQLLIEPLSDRELEVLRLIEAGCSNQEIADRLVISVLTTKRHISNIYGKLGVRSRTHAVSLGRELDLLR